MGLEINSAAVAIAGFTSFFVDWVPKDPLYYFPGAETVKNEIDGEKLLKARLLSVMATACAVGIQGVREYQNSEWITASIQQLTGIFFKTLLHPVISPDHGNRPCSTSVVPAFPTNRPDSFLLHITPRRSKLLVPEDYYYLEIMVQLPKAGWVSFEVSYSSPLWDEQERIHPFLANGAGVGNFEGVITEVIKATQFIAKSYFPLTTRRMPVSHLLAQQFKLLTD